MSGPPSVSSAARPGPAASPFQRSSDTPLSAAIPGGAFQASRAQAELERLADLGVPEKSKTPAFVAVAAVALVGIGLAVVASSKAPAPAPLPLAQPTPTKELRRSSTNVEQGVSGDAASKDAATDFAKTFKAGAGIAGTAVSAVAQPTTTFSSDLALTALREAEPKARACYRVGGPTHAEVVVRFQPSGRASQVRATGELAGTPTGMCLVAAFRDLEIASFQGGAQEIRGDVSLQ
jgi:hypothetical protein